jgi:hypothetical protein
MYTMFGGATDFDQNISTWSVSAVTDMDDMFIGASTFNQDLSTWNPSSVTTASNIFRNCPVGPLTAKYPPFTNGLPTPPDSYYGYP